MDCPCFPVFFDEHSSKKARRTFGERSSVSLLTQVAFSSRFVLAQGNTIQKIATNVSVAILAAVGNASLVPPSDGIILYRTLVHDGAYPVDTIRILKLL